MVRVPRMLWTTDLSASSKWPPVDLVYLWKSILVERASVERRREEKSIAHLIGRITSKSSSSNLSKIPISFSKRLQINMPVYSLSERVSYIINTQLSFGCNKSIICVRIGTGALKNGQSFEKNLSNFRPKWPRCLPVDRDIPYFIIHRHHLHAFRHQADFFR